MNQHRYLASETGTGRHSSRSAFWGAIYHITPTRNHSRRVLDRCPGEPLLGGTRPGPGAIGPKTAVCLEARRRLRPVGAISWHLHDACRRRRSYYGTWSGPGHSEFNDTHAQRLNQCAAVRAIRDCLAPAEYRTPAESAVGRFCLQRPDPSQRKGKPAAAADSRIHRGADRLAWTWRVYSWLPRTIGPLPLSPLRPTRKHFARRRSVHGLGTIAKGLTVALWEILGPLAARMAIKGGRARQQTSAVRCNRPHSCPTPAPPRLLCRTIARIAASHLLPAAAILLASSPRLGRLWFEGSYLTGCFVNAAFRRTRGVH